MLTRSMSSNADLLFVKNYLRTLSIESHSDDDEQRTRFYQALVLPRGSNGNRKLSTAKPPNDAAQT